MIRFTRTIPCRSVWPSERAAAEALVQSAAVFCSHRLRKIFLHAGTSGPINGATAGSVFFDMGNPFAPGPVDLGATPVYFLTRTLEPEHLKRRLSGRARVDTRAKPRSSGD